MPIAEAIMERGPGGQDAVNDDGSPFCCRCKEDFPVVREPATWQMGKMRLLAMAPETIRRQFRDWLTHPTGKHLCGNCYFDLTDED